MIAAAQHHNEPFPDAGIIVLAPIALAVLLYAGGVISQYRRGRTWPWRRAAVWSGGVAAVGFAVAGPVVSAAHHSFTAHAAVHVLIGMIAPLLLVIAAPITLALRTMEVVPARRLSRLLRSAPASILIHPIVAAVLNVGGMWVFYLSGLYSRAQQDPLLHALVMAHFLAAGFLYTASLIPVDPAPHRTSYRLRATVLVASLAAHGILAKLLYANPPDGVAIPDARSGAMLMYYTGDVVDLVIIVLLCAEWYRRTGRSSARSAGLLTPP